MPPRRGEAGEEGDQGEEEARAPQGGPGQAVGELPAPLPAGLQRYVLDALTETYGAAGLGGPPRPDERADPHDPHPEHRRRERREGVRGAPARVSQRPRARGPQPGHRLGRRRAAARPRPRTGRRSRTRPLPELIDVIRPGGLGPQKAPRLQATLRHDPRGARRLLARVPRRPAGARGARLADDHRRHRQEDRVDRARLLLRHPADGGRPARGAGVASGSACCRRRPPPTRRTTCTSGSSSRTRCTRPTCC